MLHSVLLLRANILKGTLWQFKTSWTWLQSCANFFWTQHSCWVSVIVLLNILQTLLSDLVLLTFSFNLFPSVPLFFILFCSTVWSIVHTLQFFTCITVLWWLFPVGFKVCKILHRIMLSQLNLEISCPDWICDIHHLFTEICCCGEASMFPFSCRKKTIWCRRKTRTKAAWERSKIVDLLWQKRGIEAQILCGKHGCYTSIPQDLVFCRARFF